MQKKLRMMDMNHKENDFCMRFIFLRGGGKNMNKPRGKP